MRTSTGRATNGLVNLTYEQWGPGEGEPLLLIVGIGVQRHFWPDGLCAEFVAKGFDVVRFDNRDAGESTHLSQLRAPSMMSLMSVPKAVAPYRLSDMAADAVAVMDARGWSSAHVVGLSMGGMIAQTVAIRHPERVRSLVSISSTPSPRIGRPSLAARRIFLMPPARTAEQQADRMVRQFRIIGSPGYPLDEQWLRDYARSAFHRAHDPAGMRRQLAATMASGSRLRGLRGVTAPTLVVHGAADPLIRPLAGRITAAAVRGSTLVVHPGMGHDLPRELWPRITADVARVAERAAWAR